MPIRLKLFICTIICMLGRLAAFFTTKPTGEGTGLGLSLSYDIIVKVYNGTIRAESIEGDGAEFNIELPIN